MSGGHPRIELAMRVHGELSQAIAPATPDTIRASSLKHNRALQVIGVFGLIGLAMLFVSYWLPGCGGGEVPGVDCSQLPHHLRRLSGALLGAAFYAFWTARDYLRDGTFNQRYSQVYLVRFGLGVLAGYILGALVREATATADGSGNDLAEAAARFGPFTLAVVGGFSAEAVVQILQRISDILVATVRGSDKQRTKSDAQRLTAKRMNESAAKLQAAMQIDDPEEMNEAVQSVIREMLRR